MQPEKEERPATSADVEAILAAFEQLPVKTDVHDILHELERLRAEVMARQGPPSPPASVPAAPTPLSIPPPAEQLVTLDQIGAMVHRSKRSMERYRGQMPAPRVRGRRGRPHLWVWSEVRPWLEDTFGLHLPEHFPGHTH